MRCRNSVIKALCRWASRVRYTALPDSICSTVSEPYTNPFSSWRPEPCIIVPIEPKKLISRWKPAKQQPLKFGLPLTIKVDWSYYNLLACRASSLVNPQTRVLSICKFRHLASYQWVVALRLQQVVHVNLYMLTAWIHPSLNNHKLDFQAPRSDAKLFNWRIWERHIGCYREWKSFIVTDDKPLLIEVCDSVDNQEYYWFYYRNSFFIVSCDVCYLSFILAW